MGFITGLIWGVLIAAGTVALEHYGPSIDALRISLSGNGAIAVPAMFVPLAIFWGWSWIANAYAGRSVVPMAAYTLALLLGVSLIGPTDAFFFPQSGSAQLGVNQLLAGLFQGILFVGFVAIVAAPIYWVLRSRVGTSRILIWALYLVSLAIAAFVRRPGCGSGVRTRLATSGRPHLRRDHRDRDHVPGGVRYPIRTSERPLGPTLAAGGLAWGGRRRRCGSRGRRITTREGGTRRTELTGWTERRTLRLGRRRSPGHRARLRRHEPPHVVRGVRQHRHEPSPLQRGGQHALVLRAGAALAARIDLAAVADVSTDPADVLVVDLLDLVDAERADLAPGSTETGRPAVSTAA